MNNSASSDSSVGDKGQPSSSPSASPGISSIPGSVVILDGKWLAAQERIEIKSESATFFANFGRKPGLATILVGDNPASHAYVASKHKAAHEVGFETFDTKLQAGAGVRDVQAAIEAANQNPAVDGILLQLPLPSGLDGDKMVALIAPEKDADGLAPLNQGLLQRGDSVAKPCTPLGAMRLIDLAFHLLSSASTGIPSSKPADFRVGNLKAADLAGLRAVVVGRSILVGKPMAALLLERNATVTVAHSKTGNLEGVCREADILVAAIGRPRMLGAGAVKPGAIVIDVGINRVADGTLCGDVDFDAASQVARAITPVPGGVGPMTVAMLMRNTLELAKRRAEHGRR